MATIFVGIELPYQLKDLEFEFSSHVMDSVEDVCGEFGLDLGVCFSYGGNYDPHSIVIGVKMDSSEEDEVLKVTLEDINESVKAFKQRFTKEFVAELAERLEIDDIDILTELTLSDAGVYTNIT